MGTSSAAKLMEAPKLNLGRMPVLRAILERLAAECGELLGRLSNETMTFFVNQIEPGNSWDILESYEDSVGAIYHAVEWDSRFLIGLDRRFVFSTMEAAYGGDASEAPLDSDRPFSSLELRIAKDVFSTVIPRLEALFSNFTPVTFSFDKMATPLDFTILGPTDVPAVIVQLLFQVQDSGGRMFLLIPQAALYPIRRKLERETSAPPVVNDPHWTRKLKTGLSRTSVSLSAVLDGETMTLGEVASLKAGQILPLRSGPKSLVTLQSGEESLFMCQAGQSNGVFTLMVDAPVSEKDVWSELLNDIQA